MNFSLFSMFFSKKMIAGGKTSTTQKKLIGIRMPAKMLELLIGMIGQAIEAKNATAVVLEVIDIAWDALRKV